MIHRNESGDTIKFDEVADNDAGHDAEFRHAIEVYSFLIKPGESISLEEFSRRMREAYDNDSVRYLADRVESARIAE